MHPELNYFRVLGHAHIRVSYIRHPHPFFQWFLKIMPMNLFHQKRCYIEFSQRTSRSILATLRSHSIYSSIRPTSSSPAQRHNAPIKQTDRPCIFHPHASLVSTITSSPILRHPRVLLTVKDWRPAATRRHHPSRRRRVASTNRPRAISGDEKGLA